jgi:hypothetical protein
MSDYRLEYIAKTAGEEVFKIVDIGVNFKLQGDKGTTLEMKPIIPRSIVVDRSDDEEMVITKSRMEIRRKRQPKAEQLRMEGVDPNV